MAALSLEQKTIKGGFWVFLIRFISRTFSLLRLIILARLLAPKDFGLIGIALLSLATLETFSESGFRQALIQKKKDISGYLNTAWTVLILRGVVLFIILFLVSPYVATFFSVPQAKLIIQIIGFSLVFKALTNIGVVYFPKNLDFNKQFLYELSGIMTDFFVSVAAALILRSAWALVFGFLAGDIARLIASYFIHPWRPKIEFEIRKTKELFGFGKWILGSSILIFLITQGDDILVGKLLGVTALGFYQLAYKISNLPATEITHVISQVTFPAYSKLQDNLPKLKQAYLKVLKLTVFLTIPLAVLIFVLARDFTRIFLGEKWLPMVPAIQILVIAGLIRALGATTGPIFPAIGKPEIDTRWQVVRLLVMAVFILPLTFKWGIVGASVVVLLSNFVATLGFGWAAFKTIRQ